MAARTAIGFSGAFLLLGMASGVWKYRAMSRDPSHVAPPYVDILHRASLLYAFACVVVAHFAEASPWTTPVTLGLTILPIAFFAVAVVSYIRLALRGERNQFRRRTFSNTWGMRILAVAEIVGFGGLFVGYFLDARP